MEQQQQPPLQQQLRQQTRVKAMGYRVSSSKAWSSSRPAHRKPDRGIVISNNRRWSKIECRECLISYYETLAVAEQMDLRERQSRAAGANERAVFWLLGLVCLHFACLHGLGGLVAMQ
jgi:hypothetical protein